MWLYACMCVCTCVCVFAGVMVGEVGVGWGGVGEAFTVRELHKLRHDFGVEALDTGRGQHILDQQDVLGLV